MASRSPYPSQSTERREPNEQEPNTFCSTAIPQNCLKRQSRPKNTVMPPAPWDRPPTPLLACLGFLARDFTLYQRKGQGRGEAAQSQLPWEEPSFRLWLGCAGLLGADAEGRVCWAETRQSLPGFPCAWGATPIICPGPSVTGCPATSQPLPLYPPLRCILYGQPATGPAFCLGKP